MNPSQPTTGEAPRADPPGADPLDRLLIESLAQRPEAGPIANLAERAIARAQLLECVAQQQRRKLVIHRWRLRLVYSAAAVLICLLVLLGGNRLLSERISMSSTDDSISSISSSESATPTTSTYVLWLGGLLFICTLAGLATESAIGPGRQSLVG